MQRTNKKKFIKPDAIFTADWHLQSGTPICRLDDFTETQIEKVKFISDLQKKYNIPIYHSGDLFDKWKVSSEMIYKIINILPNDFNTIAGNHDLPNHNFDLLYKSGIGLLAKIKVLNLLRGTHWNQIPESETIVIKDRKILIWHVMTYQGKKPWFDCTDKKAAAILRKYPEYDCIVTGHNHQTFTETHNGNLLVNPGSIFRTSASQKEHKPAVFLYFADTNTVQPVYLPIIKESVTDAHIKETKAKVKRMESFIKSLSNTDVSDVSFTKNVFTVLEKNKISKNVKKLIMEAVEAE